MRNLPFVFDHVSFSFSFQFIALCSIVVFLGASCKNSEPIEQEGLYGRWDITRAEKNGRETSYLRNGYFRINQDGTMTINITGEDESGKYTIDQNRLVMDGDKIFDIQVLRNDSLTVKYSASPGTQFLIYMNKKEDDAH